MPAEQQFVCRGFLFTKSRREFDDPWDYFDFKERVWLKEELRHDLTVGVLPEGMILETAGFMPVVVMPDERGQRVMNLTEVL